jgi:phosphate:Na+ symporter
VANLRLGMSVFLNGDLKSAQELLAQKVLFRDWSAPTPIRI